MLSLYVKRFTCHFFINVMHNLAVSCLFFIVKNMVKYLFAFIFINISDNIHKLDSYKWYNWAENKHLYGILTLIRKVLSKTLSKINSNQQCMRKPI